MKEIISAVIFIVGIYSGTLALKHFHDLVRREALMKASKGLPYLSEISRGLQQRKSNDHK
jgi:hypothetical protein